MKWRLKSYRGYQLKWSQIKRLYAVSKGNDSIALMHATTVGEARKWIDRSIASLGG
jgi:hypothetical protein